MEERRYFTISLKASANVKYLKLLCDNCKGDRKRKKNEREKQEDEEERESEEMILIEAIIDGIAANQAIFLRIFVKYFQDISIGISISMKSVRSKTFAVWNSVLPLQNGQITRDTSLLFSPTAYYVVWNC